MTFDHVTFAYQPSADEAVADSSAAETAVLQEISFQLTPGRDWGYWGAPAPARPP
ncbi:MAG: hypothetical protein R2911_17470 [Caldilineaceae bacterium]